MGRLGLAFRCFYQVLLGRPLPEEALPVSPTGPALLPAGQHEKQDEMIEKQRREAAVQIVAMLQKEGRFLDFLLEDIDSFSDEEVGGAVRSIHRGCRQIISEHLEPRPVLDAKENSKVTIQAGFDPSRIRLIGNVTGSPPFTGVLRHHGWRAEIVRVPPLPAGYDGLVLAPAEVELT